MNKRDAGIIVAGSAFLLLALAAWLALFTTGTQAAAPGGLGGAAGNAALAAPAPPPLASLAGAHAPIAAQRPAAKPGVPNVSSWVDIAPFPTVTIDFTPVATSLKLKRAGAAGYPPNGKLYVLGGRHGTDGEDISRKNIWEYTPGNPGNWALKSDLLDGFKPETRYTANLPLTVSTNTAVPRINAIGRNDIS